MQDLNESERDDGQIISAQTERNHTQGHTETGGKNSSRGKRKPERGCITGGENGAGISPHGVEARISKVQKSREPDDDIQAKRQNRIESGHGQDVYLVIVQGQRKKEYSPCPGQFQKKPESGGSPLIRP